MKKQKAKRKKATVTIQKKETETSIIMTIKEVAEYLKLSKDSVYKLVKMGEIPAAMILNKLRFDRTSIEKYFRQKENNRVK